MVTCASGAITRMLHENSTVLPVGSGRFAPALAEGAWLLAAAMVPLAFEPHASFHFVPLKSALFHTAGLIGWVAILLHAWSNWRQGSLRISKIRNPWIVAAAMVFLASVALSSFLSIDPSRSTISRTIVSFSFDARVYEVGLFLALVTFLKERVQWERLICVLLLSSLPVALLALLELYGLAPAHFATRRYGLTSFAGGPIFLGGYMVMLIPLSLWKLRRCVQASNGKLRLDAILHALLLTIQLIGLLGTEKRGPFLALVVSGMTAIVFLAWRRNRWIWFHHAFLVGIGLVVILLGLAAMQRSKITFEGIPAIQKLSLIIPMGQGTGDTFRDSLWAAVPQILLSPDGFMLQDGAQDLHPAWRRCFGFGPDTVQSVLPSKWIWLPAWPYTLLEVSCHSLFWDIFLAMGFFGLTATFWLVFEIFYSGLVAMGIPRTPQTRGTLLVFCLLSGCLAGGLLALLYQIGYFGLGFSLGFIGGFPAFVLLRRAFRPAPSRTDALLAVALITALTAHWTDMAFVFPTGNTNFLFWIMGGALVALGGRTREEPLVASKRPESNGMRNLAPVVLSAVVIVIVHAFVELPGSAPSPVGTAFLPWRGSTYEMLFVVIFVVFPTLIFGGFWTSEALPARSRPHATIFIALAAGTFYAIVKWLFLLPIADHSLLAGVFIQLSPFLFLLVFAAALSALTLQSTTRRRTRWLLIGSVFGAALWIAAGVDGYALRAESLRYLASRSQSFGDAMQADFFRRKALNIDPANTALRMELVGSLPDDPTNERALGILKQGLEISPLSQLNQELGDRYLQRAFIEEDRGLRIEYAFRARYAYSRARRYAPQSEEAWFRASVVEREFLGRLDLADRYESRADETTYSPPGSKIYINPAVWGVHYAKKSLSAAPPSLRAYFRPRAERYLDQAILSISKALKEDTQSGLQRDQNLRDLFWCYVHRGNLRRESGMPFRAACDYLMAEQFQPDDLTWSSGTNMNFRQWEMVDNGLTRSPLPFARAPLKAR